MPRTELSLEARNAAPVAVAPVSRGPMPAYEPPRLLKKRSVARVTLASFGGGGGPSGSPLAVNG
jgi:hypothetical protein